LSIIAVGSMVAGCTKPNPTYCDDATGRVCEAGFHCVDHSCVADSDATSGGADARGPVVATHQAADRVLGQDDFSDDTTATCTGASLRPLAIGASDDRVYGGDTQGRVLIWTPLPSEANRVLIWNTFPTENRQPADVVVGAGSFDVAPAQDLSAHGFAGPTDIVTVDDAMFVADPANHRILVWSPIPTSNGVGATFVLGQPDMTSADVGSEPSARSLHSPVRLAIGGDGLWVADQLDNRIVRYQLYPE
jgi:hypothetical protein